MEKFYIEIWHRSIEFDNPYAMQSPLFDTRQEALDWVNAVYIDRAFVKSLMVQNTETGDIVRERNL